jgi:site-specific recombinase XerD
MKALATIETTAIAPVTALPADRNPALIYLAGLNSEQSRRTMCQALDAIATLVSDGRADILTLPWAALRFQHTAAIRAALAERYAPTTVNKMLAALRGVLKAAWRLGQMSAEDYQRATAVEGVRGETLPAGRAITPGELSALMDICTNDQSAAGARDAAMIALLYSCGLRRAEVVALDLEDYDAGAGTLTIRGKGNKERLAHVVGGAADALADWLLIRGDEPGPLFWPVGKGKHLKHSERLTTQAVYYILQERARQAGVKEVSPHDFRRTFVGDLLDAGADIAVVQKLAGHANVTTTARYDRRPEEARRKAAELLHVPYRRRVLPLGHGDG